jgi:MFS family permease
MSYSSFMYKNAGVPSHAVEWVVSGTSLINFLTTIPAVPLMERLGRRPLLIYPIHCKDALTFWKGLVCCRIMFFPPLCVYRTFTQRYLSQNAVFSGIRVPQSFVFCVMFCISLFVLLSLFFWSLCCLSTLVLLKSDDARVETFNCLLVSCGVDIENMSQLRLSTNHNAHQ